MSAFYLNTFGLSGNFLGAI